MKNQEGQIIYVGKAVNLRSRVRSYFHASSQEHPRTRQLVSHITDLEWIVVGSELEALILEMNLIKRHKPHYNVRLKDDKRYPYIKIKWADPFPRVTVTRYMVADGSRYFGPYTSVWAVHQTLDVVRRIFPYLTCDREAYRAMLKDLESFLNGRSDDIVIRLEKDMQQASLNLKYERAAALRDQLKAIQTVVERQKVVFPADYVDSDVIAMARS